MDRRVIGFTNVIPDGIDKLIYDFESKWMKVCFGNGKERELENIPETFFGILCCARNPALRLEEYMATLPES